jgi:hypothetical protein
MEIEKRNIIDEYSQLPLIKDYLEFAKDMIKEPVMVKVNYDISQTYIDYFNLCLDSIIIDCLKYGKVYVKTIFLKIEKEDSNFSFEVDFKESYVENIIAPYNILNNLKSGIPTVSISDTILAENNLKEKAYALINDDFYRFKKERFVKNAKQQIKLLYEKFEYENRIKHNILGGPKYQEELEKRTKELVKSYISNRF